MGKVRVMQRNDNGELAEVADKPEVMTEELAGMIGAQAEPVMYEVEKGAIRRYAQAVGDKNPLYQDVEYARESRYGGIMVPPCFWGKRVKPMGLAASLFGRIQKLSGRSLGIDNGGEVEFRLPVRAGDTLTAVQRIADMYEEVGRSGNRLLLCIFETTYLNQNGDVVARERQRELFM